MGGKADNYPDNSDALNAALDRAQGYDGIICAGSLYLIGKLRTLIRKRFDIS
jgi:folylpolyglutamate synthase/dihydropteroate synthase